MRELDQLDTTHSTWHNVYLNGTVKKSHHLYWLFQLKVNFYICTSMHNLKNRKLGGESQSKTLFHQTMSKTKQNQQQQTPEKQKSYLTVTDIHWALNVSQTLFLDSAPIGLVLTMVLYSCWCYASNAGKEKKQCGSADYLPPPRTLTWSLVPELCRKVSWRLCRMAPSGSVINNKILESVYYILPI